MNETPTFCHDKEAAVLYIAFAPGEKAPASVELNENIVFRFNRAEKRAIGPTLMEFSVLVQRTKLRPRNFPLNGLQELEPEWQDKVIEMITQPPSQSGSEGLRVCPVLVQLLPIASVEKPPIPFAA